MYKCHTLYNEGSRPPDRPLLHLYTPQIRGQLCFTLQGNSSVVLYTLQSLTQSVPGTHSCSSTHADVAWQPELDVSSSLPQRDTVMRRDHAWSCNWSEFLPGILDSPVLYCCISPEGKPAIIRGRANEPDKDDDQQDDTYQSNLQATQSIVQQRYLQQMNTRGT